MVVSEPVSEKFGTGKKSRNRYRSNLVSEKSLGTGIGKIWYRKKVPVSVSKIFSTGKKYRYRYRPTFWVPSHTGGDSDNYGDDVESVGERLPPGVS